MANSKVTDLAEVTVAPDVLDEYYLVDASGPTSSSIKRKADDLPTRQILTASGAVTPGVRSVELDHDSVAIAATIASLTPHEGLMSFKNTSDSGTASHTVTLTGGTFDGTNTIATFNAPGEALIVWFDSEGDGVIVENIGSVALS